MKSCEAGRPIDPGSLVLWMASPWSSIAIHGATSGSSGPGGITWPARLPAQRELGTCQAGLASLSRMWSGGRVGHEPGCRQGRVHRTGGLQLLPHAGCGGRDRGRLGPNLDVRLRSDCASAASKRFRGARLKQCIHTAIVTLYAFILAGYRLGIMPRNFALGVLTPTQIQALVNFLASVAK